MSKEREDTLELNLLNYRNSFYTTGSAINGEVIFNLVSSHNDYKKIVVIFEGRSEVYFTLSSSNNVNHYRETESFLKHQVLLWERKNKELQPGSNLFQFSFQLSDNASIPSSLESRDGKIKYVLTAKLIRGTDNDIEASSVHKRINIQTNVDINRPDLQSPRSASKEATAGCFGIGRDLINITATIPRSGYCIMVDSIPIEVKVEPGARQQVQSLSACLIQRITCYAQGQPSVMHRVVSAESNFKIPRNGVQFTWSVPPLSLPDSAELTITNCSLVQMRYFVRVEYTANCMDRQHLDIPVIVGNVPLSTRRTNNESGGNYLPSLSSNDEGYHPPPIPGSGEDTVPLLQ